jgi:hypothetical protein
MAPTSMKRARDLLGRAILTLLEKPNKFLKEVFCFRGGNVWLILTRPVLCGLSDY